MEEPFKITEIWAIVATEPDGTEGIVGEKIGDAWMPFIMADKKRMDLIMPRAEDLQRRLGSPFKLVKFSQMEVIKEINGE